MLRAGIFYWKKTYWKISKKTYWKYLTRIWKISNKTVEKSRKIHIQHFYGFLNSYNFNICMFTYYLKILKCLFAAKTAT